MPYVFHAFHLAEQMKDENTTIVALLHDVCLVKDIVKDAVKIKSGGRTDFKWIEDMYEFIQSGADYVDGGEAFLTQLENLNYEA